MRLIYAWIEKSKNLEDFEVCFDKRYKIAHHSSLERRCFQISRREKAQTAHVLDDSYNIAAVVGSNGTGKTALLEGMAGARGRSLLLFENEQAELLYRTSLAESEVTLSSSGV